MISYCCIANDKTRLDSLFFSNRKEEHAAEHFARVSEVDEMYWSEPTTDILSDNRRRIIRMVHFPMIGWRSVRQW